jgi:hypothetical protein
VTTSVRRRSALSLRTALASTCQPISAYMDTVSRRHLGRGRRLAVSVIGLVAVLLSAGCDTAAEGPAGSLGTTAPSSGTTTPSGTTEPSGTSKPSGPLLAYRAAGEIGLVEGTSVVASAPGNFTSHSDPLLTEDGRFVFAHAVDGAVVAIEVASRKTSMVSVPPGVRIGTGGGSTVVWLEQPGRLMEVDLADPAAGPALRQQIALPESTASPRLLTARGGTAVLARAESAPSADGGSETLYAVRGDAEPASLGAVESDLPVGAATLSPDGSRLAYGLFRPTGNTCGTAAVVVTSADGSQQTFDVSTPDAQTGSQVLRMWWDESGPMRLSLATWRCDPESHYSPLVWEFGDDRLKEVDPRTVALQSADVVPGQRALIVPQGGLTPEASGTLIVEDSGRRFPVKSDVDAIDVVPAAAPS